MAHKMRIKTDDNVVVISGKDKGRIGKVLAVNARAERVVVEGVNIVKRHQKPTPGRPNAAAGVIEFEGPIHISNVAILDPKDRKPTRITVERRANGVRMRVTKRSQTELD